MQAVKRVEIVVNSLEVGLLQEHLAAIGIIDYTLIREAYGHGDRGTCAGDDLRGEFTNSYVLIACEPVAAERLVQTVRPFLRQHGGMCLVSDALWVRH